MVAPLSESKEEIKAEDSGHQDSGIKLKVEQEQKAEVQETITAKVISPTKVSRDIIDSCCICIDHF